MSNQKKNDTIWVLATIAFFLFCLGMRIYWNWTIKGNPFTD